MVNSIGLYFFTYYKEDNIIIIKNAFKHFKTITTHKYYVFQACWKAGIVWQGITHDLSKYSPTEFFNNIK